MANEKDPYMGLEQFVNQGIAAVAGKAEEAYGGYIIRESNDKKYVLVVQLERTSTGATIPKHHTAIPKADIKAVITELQKIGGSSVA